MTNIGMKASDTHELNHALKTIKDASSHLLGIINEVLDMAKIEANKLALSPVEYDFRKMLQRVVELIKYRTDEKQQELSVKIDKKIPDILIGDDHYLAQIITNLLSNAVKFTPDYGKIYLDVLQTAGTEGFCELRIEVSDTGIGISKEKQAKLFDAFEQADKRTRREYGGTGLGLTITKRLVEFMGGNIWVESESHKGAKFIVIIKAELGKTKRTGKEPDDTQAAENKNTFAGKHLLLVEDLEINREILIVLLGDLGLTIDCAVNGLEALEKITNAPEKYDIVFMDIQMPKMDGLEATERIRALPTPTRSKLPIIAMTANVFKDDVENYLAIGMDDHLGKPIDIEKVHEILHTYLDDR
jgi:CheY-like chemotaxis protein